ncbi:MAG TPA: transposase [Paracoccus sp.]|nr:transposase [Paracoccus sp. (in: a-proteobacteria)]
MSDHRYRPEVEILSVTDTGRRRRWTDAQKVRIVEESFGPRGSMSETARRHDIGRTLLVRWRRQYRDGALSGGAGPLRFMPVTLAPPEVPATPPAPGPEPVPTSIERAEITLLNGRRLSVAAMIDPVVLTRLVQALDPS